MAKAAQKKAAGPVETVEHIPCLQNSAEWLEARRGLITASNFKIILREGKDGKESATRRDLLYKLAGERLSGQVNEGFKSDAMKRGNEMEAEAAERYVNSTFEPVRAVGFVKRIIPSKFGGEPLVVGASPDRLVGSKGGLEIKTMAPHLLIEQAERGTPPTEHRAQVHGTMWVANLEYVDLMLFYRGMPIAPRYRFERDEIFIQEIRNEVERFEYDLKQVVKKIRAMAS